MKLGLVIKITNGGESEGFSINKNDSWAHYATDARSAIKELSNFDASEKTVYLLKFLGTLGYLLCVIKARPEGSGRPNDNTAAWVHVPSNVRISSEETINILKNVEQAISEKKKTNEAQLIDLFNREYETDDVLISAVGTIASKQDSSYGIRYYNGDFLLNELLGPYVAQQEYGKYKGIILIDQKQGILHNSNTELIFEPKKILRFNPVETIDGFTAYFKSQTQFVPFSKSIEVPDGTSLSLFWRRKNYAIIQKTFIAKGGPTLPNDALIRPVDYKVLIPKNIFFVTDNNNIPIKEFDVSINFQWMEGEFMEISEASYQQGLTITVKSKGYSDWQKYNFHLQLDRQQPIMLVKRMYHYEFSIPVYDGDKDTKNDAILTVETHRKISSSPIKGYTTYGDRIQEGEGHVNRLFVDDRWLSKIKYMAYGFASCVLVLLLYAGCSALENYEFQLDWPPFKKVSQQHTEKWNNNDNSQDEVGTDNVPVDSLSLAINYLDRNEVWNKDSLEAYPATKGLFDYLNDFDVSNVTSKFETQLSGSTKLEQVKNALIDNSDKRYNPRIGKDANDGKYNPANDKKISVPNYIDWLSKDHSKDIPKQEQPTTPSKIKEGYKKVTPKIGNEKPEQPKNNGRKIN
jgi:hypothetical protein